MPRQNLYRLTRLIQSQKNALEHFSVGLFYDPASARGQRHLLNTHIKVWTIYGPQTYNKVLSYIELYKSFSVCISDVIFLWYLKVFSMPIYYSYKSVINFLLSCNENPGGLKKWHAKKKLFSACSQNKHFEFWIKNIYGITFIFPVNRSVRQLTKSNFLNSTENTFVVPREFIFQISTTFFN